MGDLKIQKLADFILNSKYTVILTGAGCSVDSGVPDFRSPQGWWKKIDPRTVATVEALKTNYDLFRSFYQARIQHLDGITPHEGHRVLSRWEKEGSLQLLATQNVDGLHQASGSRHVRELHGSIRSFRCHNCQRHASKEQFMLGEHCSECGEKLRPNVVLFGESMPEEEWARSLEAVRKAELVIVIGTSLQVYPANQLPRMTSGRTVLINVEETGEEDRFNLFIAGRAVEVLPAVEEAIKSTHTLNNEKR
ncbi:NAD-dependent deacylase [Paenibacillus sp. tmac-D7]|uniref:SIR2 family NAD-dependent protein deacylase n=1 Tax=Paenibacillus sp. tmac-D7 TaxID=2591462 RepID=UPI0011414400|nr:NAD-dependent deacylase [Paenibacillus sp. tmac-D7]